jgi:hypothetical protein
MNFNEFLDRARAPAMRNPPTGNWDLEMEKIRSHLPERKPAEGRAIAK